MTSGIERDVINSQPAELRTEQTSRMVETKEVIRDYCFGRDVWWFGVLNESSNLRVEQRCQLWMKVMSNGRSGGMGLERTSYLVVAILWRHVFGASAGNDHGTSALDTPRTHIGLSWKEAYGDVCGGSDYWASRYRLAAETWTHVGHSQDYRVTLLTVTNTSYSVWIRKPN